MGITLPHAAPESVGLSSEGLSAVDDALKGLITNGDLAGAVTLVARKGKVVHRSKMGLKDLATQTPLDHDTIFRIYSMTKPVTGAAMMILHDEGLWRPEDPIASHIPEFAAVQVFAGMNPDGSTRLEAPHHAPTMGELMTHTAGLSYGFDPTQPVDKLYIAAGIWQSASLAEMAAKLASLPLNYQPGSKWLYSLSMDLQGAIIEKLSGQSLPDFLHSRIFGPLGMDDTGFILAPEKVARIATLYRASASGLTVVEHPPMSADPVRLPALPSGGGGLFSTAADYARFAQMLLNRGELDGVRVLSADAVALMSTNHLSDALLAGGFGVGKMQMRPGYGYGFDGAVFHDPVVAGVPVGKGTYQWDGAAGTWFWVDWVNELIYVGLIQRMGGGPNLPPGPNAQEMTQHLIAKAIIAN